MRRILEIVKPSRPIAWLLAILVIAAQLATSAYACTMPAAPGVAPAMQAMEDCAGMDDPASPLCERHCRDEAQTQSPVIAALPAFAPSFVAVVAQPVPQAMRAFEPRRALHHATSPPLAIRLCCLRV